MPFLRIAKTLVLPFVLAALAVVVLGAVANAQVAPAEPDPAGMLTQLIAALGSGGYLVAALLGTALVVWVAEHYGPKLLPVLGKPIPSALLALAMSLIVPVINAIAGGKLTVTVILGALSAGLTAWGGPAKLIALFTGQGNPGVEL